MNTVPPPTLRPLVAVLTGLDPLVRDEVARLGQRLDALFGPLRPRTLGQGGEPNGVRGLNRRGPYDRLLLSEWALLDEVPDEFVRRAIAGEHAFYELDTQSPTLGLRIRAVFDAGPEQLGSPRIVQLAVLFVLLKRAIAANAELEWSVAQRPGVVHTAVDRDSVAALLGARSNQPFILPKLDNEPPADETWIVGPAPAPGLEPFRVLHIREALTAEGEDVVVVLHRRGRAGEELHLPLPPAPARKRLITDPFAAEPTPARPTGIAPPPDNHPQWRPFNWKLKHPVSARFVEGTTQLAAFFAAGEVCLWSLSKLPGRGMPKPQWGSSWKPAERIAFGYYKQTPFDVVFQDDAVCTTGATAVRVPSPRVWPTAGLGGAWVAAGRVYFVDGDRRLWSAALGGNELILEGANITDVQLADGCFSALALTEAGAVLHSTSPGLGDGGRLGAPMVINRLRDEAPIQRAWFPRGRWAWGCFTQEGESTVLRPWRGQLPALLAAEVAAPDERVLARICAPQHNTLADDRWLRWTPGTGRFVLTGSDPFVVPRTPLDLSVSDDGRFLAFVTEERTVELWDVTTGQPRMLRHEGA